MIFNEAYMADYPISLAPLILYSRKPQNAQLIIFHVYNLGEAGIPFVFGRQSVHDIGCNASQFFIRGYW